MVALLSDVRPILFRAMAAEDRSIVPIEAGKEAPFDILRVFTIRATRAGLVGGRHAHYRCTQLLICVEGACDVLCSAGLPGEEDRIWRLDDPARGLLIPPTIWAEQRYLADPTVLTVLCDRPYEADDYIRDLEAFRSFRGVGA
jgi:hypothetical protein